MATRRDDDVFYLFFSSDAGPRARGGGGDPVNWCFKAKSSQWSELNRINPKP